MFESEGLGEAFQSKTAYRRDAVEERELDWRSRPSQYKFYPYASVVSLPDPQPSGDEDDLGLATCIARRRSVRSFATTPISLEQLSRLLWECSGATQSFITPHGQDFYRAAPSAGALYPIETYVVVNRVDGISPGLYHYRPTGMDVLERPIVEGSHSLEQLVADDLGMRIKAVACDQPMCAKASVVIIWTAIFPRSIWKYRDRAYRYCYLDAGHMAAHLSLSAVSLGLASCQIAAFYDDEANALLEVDGRKEGVIYMSAVGAPARPFGGRVDLRHTGRPKE